MRFGNWFLALGVVLTLWVVGTLGTPMLSAQTSGWSRSFTASRDTTVESVAVDTSGNAVIVGTLHGEVDLGGGPLVSVGFEDIFVAKLDSNGSHLWSQRFGDTDFQRAEGVTVDASNNVVITGIIRGTVDFGGGPLSATTRNIFVTKFDPAGIHMWSQSFGDAVFDRATRVAVDGSGNIIIAGSAVDNVDFGGGSLPMGTFLAKLDAGGSHVWSQGFAQGSFGSGDPVASVAVDALSNVVMTGPFIDPIDFGGGVLTSLGDSDVFLAKFDSAGGHLWSRRFGDFDHQEAETIGVDTAGNVVIEGSLNGTVDFGGGPLTASGFGDIFLARFDADGNHLWSRRFGGSRFGNGIAVDSSGSISITGFGEGVDLGAGILQDGIFVARLDSGGDHLWSQRLGDPDAPRVGPPNVIAVDSADNAVVAGSFAGTIDSVRGRSQEDSEISSWRSWTLAESSTS